MAPLGFGTPRKAVQQRIGTAVGRDSQDFEKMSPQVTAVELSLCGFDVTAEIARRGDASAGGDEKLGKDAIALGFASDAVGEPAARVLGVQQRFVDGRPADHSIPEPIDEL